MYYIFKQLYRSICWKVQLKCFAWCNCYVFGQPQHNRPNLPSIIKVLLNISEYIFVNPGFMNNKTTENTEHVQKTKSGGNRSRWLQTVQNRRFQKQRGKESDVNFRLNSILRTIKKQPKGVFKELTLENQYRTCWVPASFSAT